MALVEVEAVRVVDDSQWPHIVEFRLTDAHGGTHRIIDKIAMTMEQDFAVPSRVHFSCTIDAVEGDSLRVTLGCYVEDHLGNGTFVVSKDIVTDYD